MGVKSRVIPVLLFDEHGCVKGQGFDPGRRIGSLQDRLRLLERRDIDELVLLDIQATRRAQRPRFEEIKTYCSGIFCPIAIGGGVSSIDDFRSLLANGADKVVAGTAPHENPELIDSAAHKFGSQAVVISIDVKAGSVWSHSGTINTGRDPVAWAKECEARGAGELLLTDIERDGTMSGYNLELVRTVSNSVSIPVVACGGCGSYEDMEAAMKAGAHAVAAGAMFQFREQTPKGAARFLNEHGIPARV